MNDKADLPVPPSNSLVNDLWNMHLHIMEEALKGSGC